MMKTTKILLTGTLLMAFGGMCAPAFSAITIDADDFVEDASAASIGEIENAKLALQKSTAADVKAFAQEIITDHTAVNKELAGIAAQKKLKVSTDAELMTKAKAFMLKQRKGQSFNEAYAENQVKAHMEAIELFNKAAGSDDVELSAFAKAALPKLEHHLMQAQDLAKMYHKK